jgi:hypothetical protein
MPIMEMRERFGRYRGLSQVQMGIRDYPAPGAARLRSNLLIE